MSFASPWTSPLPPRWKFGSSVTEAAGTPLPKPGRWRSASAFGSLSTTAKPVWPPPGKQWAAVTYTVGETRTPEQSSKPSAGLPVGKYAIIATYGCPCPSGAPPMRADAEAAKMLATSAASTAVNLSFITPSPFRSGHADAARFLPLCPGSRRPDMPRTGDRGIRGNDCSVRVAAAGAAAGGRAGVFALRDLEARPAAAGGDHVRVVDLEPGLLEALQEVDRRALQVGRAERVDDD